MMYYGYALTVGSSLVACPRGWHHSYISLNRFPIFIPQPCLDGPIISHPAPQTHGIHYVPQQHAEHKRHSREEAYRVQLRGSPPHALSRTTILPSVIELITNTAGFISYLNVQRVRKPHYCNKMVTMPFPNGYPEMVNMSVIMCIDY